ncbi:MAG: hypothetical protein A2X64_06970 [Ignavibacteria bacterium GWF2_33_9]|nr:MAG: hypothetical protein A2X64_06970 [Ignavibacteria bacterium GWF2_33_9]
MKKTKFNILNQKKSGYNLIFLIFLSFFAGLNFAQSKAFVQVPDTTLYHSGSTYSLPLLSNIDMTNVNSLKITLEFSELLIDFKGIQAGANYGINENAPDYQLTFDSNNIATLEIYSTSFNSSYSGELCNLLIETLAGPDSVAVIFIKNIEINGEILNDIDLISGNITIGIPIFPIIKEGINLVYPNPFSTDCTISFSIRDDTKVKFEIFSLNGKLIGSSSGEGAFSYVCLDKNNQPIENMNNNLFTRGYYKFILSTINWKFASGLYFIVMKTERGTYETKLMLLK